MNILDLNQVSGGVVSLERTNSTHLQGALSKGLSSNEGAETFSNMVIDALNGANSLAQESTRLTEQYIINPDSVDVHDVTIAMGKANLAISMTKSVVDGAIKAYREIINIR
ncbi:MAG: flagellar hook-basal body complex protein FliE [Spirochaetales bacterium]|nr:flagellar hook-basal body complex protein FliE [Spirochaetales bacterium]